LLAHCRMKWPNPNIDEHFGAFLCGSGCGWLGFTEKCEPGPFDSLHATITTCDETDQPSWQHGFTPHCNTPITLPAACLPLVTIGDAVTQIPCRHGTHAIPLQMPDIRLQTLCCAEANCANLTVAGLSKAPLDRHHYSSHLAVAAFAFGSAKAVCTNFKESSRSCLRAPASCACASGLLTRERL
jgi:hypothetical protein